LPIVKAAEKKVIGYLLIVIGIGDWVVGIGY